MFRIFIGKAGKGGSVQQEAEALEKAAKDLEGQLNSSGNRVQAVQGILIHDINPLHVEILAIAQISELPTPRKKGE